MKYLLTIIMSLFASQLCHVEYSISEDDLGRCLVAYFREVDLNSDGKLEDVKVIEPCKIFTNVPDSEWGDDTGILIRIIDDSGKVVYESEVMRYQHVESVVVKDVNGDGFKEVIISVGQDQEGVCKPKGYLYRWNGKAYGLLGDE